MKRTVTTLLKQLIFLLQYIGYEIYYYLIGGSAMIEDLVYKKNNKCDTEDKTGQVAVVTGGARGIGYVLVEKLLKCNMHVIICCRNVNAGLEKIKKIKENGVKTGCAYVYELDLNSLKSVRACAAKISNDFTYINILVNNAGIMFPPYTETEEGFESQWGVNYIGHFLLTHLLMPLLEKSHETKSRIINVTSCAHVAASSIQFDNINMKNYFISSKAYAQSKLAQILFTIHLEKILRQSNSNVHVLSVHPGIVDTDIFDGTPLKQLFPWVLRYICKTAEEGAIGLLYACINPKLEGKGALYLSNCSIQAPSKLAQDQVVQKDLFNYTMKILNIDEFGNNRFIS